MATPLPWGIVDAARDPRILPALRAMAPDARCLFDEPVDPHLAEAAPWMLPLDADQPFLEWWRNEGVGHAWGIAVLSTARPEVLRRHLKKLLRAQLPQGEIVYFRFYDPRVLWTYLTTTEPKALREFFGPVRKLFIESPRTGRFVGHELKDDALTPPIDL